MTKTNTMYTVMVNGFAVGVEMITSDQMDRIRYDQDIRVKTYSDRLFDNAVDEYNNSIINALIKSA